jgi:hypothetical protein
MVGKGVAFGKTDSNIANGLTVEAAVDTLVKAIYLKRFWITLGSLYLVLAPKILGLSESIYNHFVVSNF